VFAFALLARSLDVRETGGRAAWGLGVVGSGREGKDGGRGAGMLGPR